MLETVTAIRFDKLMSSGRTKPCLVSCLRNDGSEVELVLKMKAGCGSNGRPLVNEAIAALLASDLGLPVPEPFVVNMGEEFAMTIPDAHAQSLARQSIGLNFGSLKLPPGFFTIPKDTKFRKTLQQTAAEILAFDVFIENSDRRISNPNLLYNGKTFALFDHELAFAFDKVLFWQPPWEDGAIRKYPLSSHVLFGVLRGKNPDFGKIEAALKSLNVDRLREYGQSIPNVWIDDEGVALNSILEYINELANHATEAIAQLRGALQ